MPTIELTTAVVKTLHCEPGASETIYWDKTLPGFGLRCRASGVRTWFVQYRTKLDNKTRRESLADKPGTAGGMFDATPDGMTLAAARRRAKDTLAGATKGGDPAAAAGKVRGLPTMRELATAYLDVQRKKLRPGSFAAVQRHLGETYAPIKALLGRKVATITARDVALALEEIATENGPIAANPDACHAAEHVVLGDQVAADNHAEPGD